MNAYEREPIDLPANKVTIIPTTNTIIPNNEPKEVQGRFNIGPTEYRLEELGQCDKEKLIEIVKDLHIKYTQLILITKNEDIRREDEEKEYKRLKREHAALKKELAEYKRLPNNDSLYNTIDLLKRENALLRQQQLSQETKSTPTADTNTPEKDWLLSK